MLRAEMQLRMNQFIASTSHHSSLADIKMMEVVQPGMD
jgi:hypothetical protein